MGIFLLLQELLLTASVVLLFSFLIAKLFSDSVSANGDHINSSEKGVDETVNFDRGLKIGGRKNKKRVRVAVEEDDQKVNRIEGQEGSYGEVEESGGEICGNKEGGLGNCLEEKREVDISKGGNVVDTYLGQLSVEEKVEGEYTNDETGEQIGVFRVLEELSGEERSESNVSEGKSVNTGSEELIVTEKYLTEEAYGVIGGQSGEFGVFQELVEERCENYLEEGNLVKVENIENVEADDEKIVSLVSDDLVGHQIGHASVWKDLVAEHRIENTAKEAKNESEEAGNEMNVKLASEVVVCEETEEVRVPVVRDDQGSGIGGELDKGKKKNEALVSDEDDDWEGIEKSELEKVFASAASYAGYGGKDDRTLNLGSDVQMQLYGLQKVAMEGPCYEAQPMALKISARAKWYQTFLYASIMSVHYSFESV